MSDEYFYDPTAESDYQPPADEQVDNWDLQGTPLFGPEPYDPRANSGLTNYNPADPYANTYYDPSVAGPEQDISGPSMSYDPKTGINTLYDPRDPNTAISSFQAGQYGSSGISGGKAAPSKNIVKRATDSLKDKESTGRSILDAILAMYAIKSTLDQRKIKDQARGYQDGINMNRVAVQPSNIPATRAYGAGAVGQPYKATTYAAEGGIMGLAAGGLRNGSFVIPADVVSHFGNGSSEAGMKFLQKKLGATPIKGKGDGMSDSIDTTIDGKQPAKVAHEEALVSPEKVAALGKGDPKKGAKVLYAMMDRVRKARTGTKKQGKQIRPEKFMPGGIASLAGGGAVAFNVGGAAATPTTPTAGTSVTSNLSEWAGPYVTDMLSQANALGNQPYQAYTGQLTAGTSPLQQQAFDAYKNLQTPGAIGQAAQTAGGIAGQMQGLKYNPVGSDFTSQAAQQYMNPYIQAALNPQLEELNRQNQITQMGQQAKLAQAGGFGGSRDAILRAENARNLGQLQSQVLGTGYATAYDKAMQQFNADQARKVGESQFGARFGLEGLQGALSAAQTQGNLGVQQGEMGLKGLAAQLGAGQQQSAIEQQALDAQRAQFEEARAYPYKQLQFKQSMLSGLPISTQNAVAQTTGMQDLSALIDAIRGIGSAT
jgi:hypothetical protein